MQTFLPYRDFARSSRVLDGPRLGKQLGLSRLLVKDESQLPTGSFKSRGMTAAISLAKWLGVKRVALPTAGNAGGAAAAYAADVRAGTFPGTAETYGLGTSKQG